MLRRPCRPNSVDAFTLAMRYGAPPSTAVLFTVRLDQNTPGKVDLHYTIDSHTLRLVDAPDNRKSAKINCAVVEYDNAGAVLGTTTIQVAAVFVPTRCLSLSHQDFQPQQVPGTVKMVSHQVFRDANTDSFGTLNSPLPLPRRLTQHPLYRNDSNERLAIWPVSSFVLCPQNHRSRAAHFRPQLARWSDVPGNRVMSNFEALSYLAALPVHAPTANSGSFSWIASDETMKSTMPLVELRAVCNTFPSQSLMLVRVPDRHERSVQPTRVDTKSPHGHCVTRETALTV